MVSRLTVALLACLALIVPATASAALDVTHDRVDVTEVSGVLDGVASPGDRLNLRERFRSATQITGVTGHLLSTTPGVSIADSTASFPSIPAGGFSRNSDPFDVILPATGLDCGTRLVFAMNVVANEDSGAFAFTIPTGAAGPVKVYGDDPARAIDDATTVDGGVVPGVTEVVVNVPETESGLIKSLNLRLPRIDHPRIGDLKLELIAPDATKIVLADGRGGTGANMVNTVFSDVGTPIAGASAPFTGTYAPEQPLRVLEGRRLAGPWSLRITDTAIGETGTLQSWRIDARRAFCAGIPIARLAMTSAGAAVTQVQPGQQVDFDASGSTDQNGSIVSYEFDIDGQPGFEIGPTTDATHSFTYPTRGTYPINVRVTDDAGLTDTETVDLPVTDAPVAALTASALTPLSQTAVTFNAAGSTDPDGTVERYEWDLDGNNSFETDTQGVATASMTYETPGARTVRVRVTDNLGARDTEQVVVTVQNRPPVASATIPALVLAGKEGTFDATASSDPDGTVRRYEWDLDGNGSFERDMSDEPILEHTFTTGGPVAVSLRVTDDSGAGDTEVFPIVVRHAPAVTLSATPNPASPRRPVNVTAVATDADSAAETLTYAWDLDGNGTYEVAPSPQSARVMQWPVGGTRTVGVLVADPQGATAAASVQIVVRNLLPTADIKADQTSVLVGTPLALDARGSTDPDGDVMTYRWDLDGNGSFEHDTGTSGTTAVTYAAPGTARPAVRVTDDDAATSTKAIDVAVTSPAPPPGPGGTGDAPAAAADGGSAGPGTPVTLAPPVSTLGGTRAVTPAPAPGYSATLAGASGQKLKTVLRKGVALTCTAPVAGRCILEAKVSGRDARRLGLSRSAKKPVTVGRVTAKLVAGRPAPMALKLSATARRKLGARRAGRVQLQVTGLARDWSGRQAPLSRVVLLRP